MSGVSDVSDVSVVSDFSDQPIHPLVILLTTGASSACNASFLVKMHVWARKWCIHLSDTRAFHNFDHENSTEIWGGVSAPHRSTVNDRAMPDKKHYVGPHVCAHVYG